MTTNDTISASFAPGTRVRVRPDANPFEYGPVVDMGLAFMLGAVGADFPRDADGCLTGTVRELPNADTAREHRERTGLTDEQVKSEGLLADDDEVAEKAAEYGVVNFAIDGDTDELVGFPFYAAALEAL